MQYSLCIGILYCLSFQNCIAMGPEERTFSNKEILAYIIRFSIAGQAHSNDLTQNGHYVCFDFVEYKNDQDRPIKPRIVNLYLINKAFYKITNFILEQYHKEPVQISNLVDFFCTHFQDSIDKEKLEELLISIYLAKYILHLNYFYCNTVFNSSMSIIMACTTNQLLQQYQQDLTVFTEENKSLIDPDACSIKFHKNQLKRYYYIYAKLFSYHVFLPQTTIEFCLEKMTSTMSPKKEQDIISNKQGWAFFLQECLTYSDNKHIDKRCEKVHCFLTKIFSYSQLTYLQDKIRSACMQNANNALNCPTVTHFILNRCIIAYTIVKNSCELSIDEQMCFSTQKTDATLLLDPELIHSYLKKEISFVQFTLKNFKND